MGKTSFKLSQYCEESRLPQKPNEPGLSFFYSYLSGEGLLAEPASIAELIDRPKLNPRLFDEARRVGILVPSDLNELDALLSENAAVTDSSKDLYRVIMPSATCNFGCAYCGQEHGNVALASATQTKIISEIAEAASTGRYERLTVGWFGGEPLSAAGAILALSTRLIDLAATNSLEYSAKIVTNGYALTRQTAERLIEKCLIKKFEVTLDGPKLIHDQRRPLRGGQPSFDQIARNIDGLLESKPNDVEVVIRCNVSLATANFVPDLLFALRRRSWQDKVRLYFSPVHDWGTVKGEEIEGKRLIAGYEIEWLLLMKELGFSATFLPQRRYITCLATNKHAMLYAPDGSVHDCTEVPLTISAQHYVSSSGDRPNNFGDFYSAVSTAQYGCTHCRILPVCGGACPKQWKEGQVPCPTFKFNSRERLLFSLAENGAAHTIDHV